jgi:hypothetical protein
MLQIPRLAVGSRRRRTRTKANKASDITEKGTDVTSTQGTLANIVKAFILDQKLAEGAKQDAHLPFVAETKQK